MPLPLFYCHLFSGHSHFPLNLILMGQFRSECARGGAEPDHSLFGHFQCSWGVPTINSPATILLQPLYKYKYLGQDKRKDKKKQRQGPQVPTINSPATILIHSLWTSQLKNTNTKTKTNTMTNTKTNTRQSWEVPALPQSFYNHSGSLVLGKPLFEKRVMAILPK